MSLENELNILMNMKKILCLFMVAGCLYTPVFSQEDDLYFIPSKAKKEKTSKIVSEYSQIENEADYNYNTSKSYSDKEVDLYNRRYVADTIPEETTDYTIEDGTYTSRIIRFHSPTIGVVVSSPFYIDYYHDWMFTFDPWGYRYIYDPWYHWGYYPPYYWGYNYYWNPWYYGPGWGIYPPPHHHGPGYPGGKPSYAYRGPGNRYGGRGGSGVTLPSSRYFSTRQPGKGPQDGRPNTSRYSSTNNDRNSSQSFKSSTTRPSRNYNTQKESNQPRTNSRPSSSYSPSRSFGNSSSFSTPSSRSSARSFGGGGRSGRR